MIGVSGNGYRGNSVLPHCTVDVFNLFLIYFYSVFSFIYHYLFFVILDVVTLKYFLHIFISLITQLYLFFIIHLLYFKWLYSYM